MKNINFILLLILLCLSSCEHEESLTPSDEFIVIEASNARIIDISLEAEYAQIDWGDGNVSVVQQPTDKNTFDLRHTYDVVGNYHIKLTTKTLQSISLGNHDYNNGVLALYDVKLGYCPNLSSLSSHYLNSIDITQCPALYWVSVSGKKMPFDVSDCPQVKVYSVNFVEEGRKTISYPRGTTSLSCSYAKIETLYISSQIRNLYCYKNELTELNASNSEKMETIDCSDNQISSLKIPNEPYLDRVNCSNNNLSEQSLDSIFASLPVVKRGVIKYENNPGEYRCDFSIAKDKGWEKSD